MTDVLLQLRSELVEEIISVAETFRQIPKDLLNSFFLSCRNHCCNIDSGFISFSTYFLFNLESFTIERERPNNSISVSERKAISDVFSDIY